MRFALKNKVVDFSLMAARSLRSDAPLVTFVHVPKSAGTSFNAALRNWRWRGIAHVARYVSEDSSLRYRLARAHWVSGHLSFEKMQESVLSLVPDRPARLFATIRNDTEHVASHYNWQIEIFARGPKTYNRHRTAIKEISERVRAVDHANPRAVIALLEDIPALFSNLQSRYILGDDIDLLGAEADRRWQAYEWVAPMEQIGALSQHITGKTPTRSSRKNVSGWHFDRAVFDTPELQEFLAEFNAQDKRLYALAKATAPGVR